MNVLPMDEDLNSEEEEVSMPHMDDTDGFDNMDYFYGMEEIDAMIYMRLHHILLPRCLPRMVYDAHDIGLRLMNQMLSTVESLSNYLPPTSVKLLKTMHQLHANFTPQTILDGIKALRPGDSLAISVRYQDCAIMFYVPPTENSNDIQNVIVATFPGNLDPKEMYKYDGDFEVNLNLL